MTDQDMADMMRQLGLAGMLKMPADPDPGEIKVNNSGNVSRRVGYCPYGTHGDHRPTWLHYETLECRGFVPATN